MEPTPENELNVLGSKLQTVKQQLTSGHVFVMLLVGIVGSLFCLYLLLTGHNEQGGAGFALAVLLIILGALVWGIVGADFYKQRRTPASRRSEWFT